MDDVTKKSFDFYSNKAIRVLGVGFNLPAAFLLTIVAGIISGSPLSKIIVLLPIVLAPFALLILFFESKYREYKGKCVDILIKCQLTTYGKDKYSSTELIKELRRDTLLDETTISKSLFRLNQLGILDLRTFVKMS